MKKLNVALITVLLSASVGASLAIADVPVDPPAGGKSERAHKMHDRLKAADADGDGKISRTEAAALPRMACPCSNFGEKRNRRIREGGRR